MKDVKTVSENLNSSWIMKDAEDNDTTWEGFRHFMQERSTEQKNMLDEEQFSKVSLAWRSAYERPPVWDAYYSAFAT